MTSTTAPHPKPSPVDEPPSSALHRFGRAVVRRRRPLLAAAALLFVVGGLIGSGTMGALVLSRYEVPGSESIVTGDELDERFAVGNANFLLLVTADDGRVDSAASAEAGAALAAELAAHGRVASVDSYWDGRSPTLVSEDGSQALILAHIPGDVTDVRENVLPGLKDDFAGEHGAVEVGVGGSDELFREVAELARGDFLVAEAIIIPSLLLLLIVLYRRPVAALLTMGVGLFSLVASLALMRGVAALVEVSTFAANLVLVMSVGLAVDYCLFIINRYREQITAGAERAEAVAATVATAGRTVLFSALTVAAGLSVLLAMPFPFLRSFAYAGLLVPLTAVVGAVVLLPAALAAWGHRVELRRRPSRPLERGRWYRLTAAVMRRPLAWGAAALALVLLLASPFLGVRFGVPDERSLPESADSRAVTDQITANFAAEATDAMRVLAHAPEEAALAAYAAELSEVPGIAQVDSAAGRFVDGERTSPAAEGRFAVAENGDTWLEAVPTGEAMRDDPYGMVVDLRAVEAPFDTAVSGYPADLADFRDALLDRLPLVLALIVLVTFVILFLMTGSVIAPLKATVLNALSLSVMFGALVWIFQEGNLSGLLGFTPQGSFEPSIPILMFCVAYGLSMDYEVFMLSRIKEEYDRTGDNARSIAIGLQRSAPLVTAAALVLAFSFAVYATGQVVLLQMLGVGMALAVVVDATVIRGVLLPSLMRLTGRWNWWAPAPLRRLHARIGVSD
ncbi:MMPL family transporter [Glycomyces tenuis]|uniref:MMPL family transporter n=1 Tax=Glycomyces tenuis TaxID=58116 RepID=UPI0004225BCA|nr:MMPL family transporter [Glycomyces tenuis]